MSRLTALILGYGCLLIGVLGLILPVLQGIPFLLAGLIILSRHAAWAQRALDWLRRRHPRVAQGIGKAERWVTCTSRWVRIKTGRAIQRSQRIALDRS